jgi:hypothetical protein
MKISEVSVKSALEYDNMAASVRRISGDTGMNDLAERTYGVHRSLLQYGVSVKDAGDATQALYSGMASFSHLLPGVQTSLQRQVALLKEVGVDSQTASQALNFMDKGLKMSTSDSIALTNKLFGLSKALKVPPEVIFRDWQASSSELAKYGAGMTEVFMGLSAQAKNTGLNMSQLLGIAKQFDEFDSAGRAVGRLNAILGGPYLNAIEMVYMTETQRIQAMRESIALSGAVFNDLSRHERQAIAAAAGIRDMTVAAQLFGGTNRQFAEAAANQADLARRAKMSQSAMNKLKDAAMGLAIAVTPLVDALSSVASVLGAIASNPVGSVLMSILAVVTPLTLKFINMSRAIKAHNALMEIQNALTGKSAAAFAAEGRAADISAGAITRHSGALSSSRMAAEAQWGALTRSKDVIADLPPVTNNATGQIRGMGVAFSQAGGFLFSFAAAGTATYFVLGKLKSQYANATGAVLGFAMAMAALNMAKSGWNPASLAIGGAGLAMFSASALQAVNMAKHAQAGLNVEAGEPVVVGEGPNPEQQEVFVPHTTGRIQSNEESQRSGLLGGNGPTADEIGIAVASALNGGGAGGGNGGSVVFQIGDEVIKEMSIGAINEALGLV